MHFVPTRIPSASRTPTLVRILLTALFLTTLAGCGQDETRHETQNGGEQILRQVSRGISFLETSQLPSGEIHKPGSALWDIFETVNAALAISLWEKDVDRNPRDVIKRALAFLRSCEDENGMLFDGTKPPAGVKPLGLLLENLFEAILGKECIETSSQYFYLLTAADYLIESQGDDGSWYYEMAGVAYTVSPELQTALALQCCFSCGLGPDDATVSKGIRWLLGQQEEDGRWDGGFFPFPPAYCNLISLTMDMPLPKEEDVAATTHALIALHQYWTRLHDAQSTIP